MKHEKFTRIISKGIKKVLGVCVIILIGIGCYYRDTERRPETNSVEAKGGSANKPSSSVSGLWEGFRDSKPNRSDYKWLAGGSGALYGHSRLLFGASLSRATSNYKWIGIHSPFTFGGRGGQSKDGGGYNKVTTKKLPPVAKGALHTSAESVNVELLCKAIGMHETNGCAPQHPGSKKNNCTSIMAWNNGVRYIKPFKTKEESYLACEKLWTEHYGGFPDWNKAYRYSGGDKTNAWLSNVTFFYNKLNSAL